MGKTQQQKSKSPEKTDELFRFTLPTISAPVIKASNFFCLVVEHAVAVKSGRKMHNDSNRACSKNGNHTENYCSVFFFFSFNFIILLPLFFLNLFVFLFLKFLY